MLIGIAGKTGAGKNAAASILERWGWRTLDLDETAHWVLDEASELIEKEFGPGLVNDEGKVKRDELGARVFGQPQLLHKLEALSYPLIEKKTLEWYEEDATSPAAIHAVNLHKTALPKHCKAILWIDADWRIRRKRVILRDGKTWRQLKGRFKVQHGLNPKLFPANAEIYRIRNTGNLNTLEQKLAETLRRLE
ncbi:MAG: dephospho-CoA kinase [Spirochaeta sp. LUC14_002_19_P3]|nr:MAG: dephospho-CoA kinase [Spirochaeta sp. LUC14_002_19_P3]